MLPDLDGLMVCEILRAQPSTRDVPVVVLSALDRPVTGSRGAKIQVAHWLKKAPISMRWAIASVQRSGNIWHA
jgi:CheY-like chemotaxis protein